MERSIGYSPYERGLKVCDFISRVAGLIFPARVGVEGDRDYPPGHGYRIPRVNGG